MCLSINTIRRASAVMRTTAAMLLLSFNFVFIFSPSALALDAEINKYSEQKAQIEQILESTPAKKLAHRLQLLKEKLTLELPTAINKREQEKNIFDQALDFFLSDLPVTSNEISELAILKNSVVDAYSVAIKQLENEAKSLDDKQLPQIARDRHAAVMQQVKGQFTLLLAKLNVLLTSDDASEQQQALDEISTMLLQTQFKRSHTQEDPNNLPWGTPKSDVRKPAQSKADLLSYLGVNPFKDNLRLASNGFNPSALSAAIAAYNAPTNSDLLATLDVQITPEIQALAEQLNHNVVEIYTWVHNNIRFIPSYGSIQGSQMTLNTKRGNAMDTASLTIALLRASNIPARYAYGTVEIPAEKVLNWVGGVNNANAAGNLLGQGGIPNTGMVMGGQVKFFQLEHTWVEAYVDFEPSRGMQNGQKDSWIPLDASFKQYDFSQGLDLEQQVPFEAQGLVDDIQATATVNEDEGWIQNVPSQAIEQKLEEYQQALTDYIENQNPDATVGEVLGMQTVKILEPRPLAAGLPYNHIVTTQQFSEVPNNLRHRFKYELATSTQGYANTPFISINEPTVKLAGKKLSLSFAPATEDDAAIIESYLPAPDPQTGQINAEDIPNTLPGYLINLKAEFAIGDQVVAQANAGIMGGELHEQLGYYDPRFGWSLATNKPVAGEYQAIGLDLQGTNPEYAAQLQADLERTKAKLESGDDAQLADLTKQDLVGDMLEATIFSYFAMNNLQDDIAAQQAGVVNYRAPSYGKFSTSLSTSYFFGQPRNVSASGLAMDVDRVYATSVDKNNDAKAWANFNQLIGNRYSAMEHLVPEQMFSTEEAPAEGISAVKAIAIAGAQGQKIWTITQDNLDVALASINLDSDTENEIRNSVNAGRVVTAHEQSINFNGWVGEGYIILDPESGAGAYKIAGGGNGGDLYQAMVGLVEIIGLISINNGLALGGASRLIPLMVSGPIGWGFTAVAGIAVLLLAILNAATGPSRWDPDSSANNFMESMLLALTLSILGALAFGGGIAILGFMIMIIMLARFIVLEAMIG